MTYFEEGGKHGKRTDDNTWCAMVMRIVELLICHWFYMYVEEGVYQGSGVV